MPLMFKRRTIGLRLRITTGYVLFFSILLAGLGLFFRSTLHSIFEANSRMVLEEEWETLIAHLNIDARQAGFRFDPNDPEETFVVSRLRRICMLADESGLIHEVSTGFRDLGIPSGEEIRSYAQMTEPWHEVRADGRGIPYVVYYRTHRARDRLFLLAVGRSLELNLRVLGLFTTQYFLLLPVMILGCALLGWILSGRALQPLNEVAAAAKSISSANLGPRIGPRGAKDELDHFIEAFNEMILRLEGSFNQIRQFSTDVSHELRTPLTAIRGQLEVALFTARTPDQFREAITNAMEDVERLSRIVRALLLLSQAESGQVNLQIEPLEVSKLAGDIVDQFQIPAEDARVSLKASLPPDVWVRGDRLQLERLLSNLISNALKYTPAGGHVRVEVAGKDSFAEIRVEDTGRGIPPQDLPHIYDRFYRVADGAVDPEKGLGLGLSFVAWIVKAHGGTILVESRVGTGTRFVVALPATRTPRPATVQVTAAVLD